MFSVSFSDKYFNILILLFWQCFVSPSPVLHIYNTYDRGSNPLDELYVKLHPIN